MDIVTKILTTFFGSKSERDIKKLMPVVTEINEIYAGLHDISNDELRQKAQDIKKEIRDHIAGDENKKEELKKKAEDDNTDVEEKERIYRELDDIDKVIDDKLEKKLEELLPRAFAIMRETSKRFKENSEVEVTANDFDRELGANKDYVSIEGSTAVYFNSWYAGGNEITWDMIPYDVQLIGGIVLHQGRIAEMATGEGKTLAATLPLFLNALAGKGRSEE